MTTITRSLIVPGDRELRAISDRILAARVGAWLLAAIFRESSIQRLLAAGLGRLKCLPTEGVATPPPGSHLPPKVPTPSPVSTETQMRTHVFSASCFKRFAEMTHKSCSTIVVGKAALAVALSCGCLALPLAAQEAAEAPAKSAIEDVGASARVEISGELRVLTQELATNACFYLAGVSVEDTKADLIESIEEFDEIVEALRNGDEEMGVIGPEPQAKTLRLLDEIEALWGPYRAAAEGAVSGDNVEQNSVYLAEHNQALLETAIVLASAVNAEYANPAELTQANAMVIDISGRQAMLTEKMLKEVCGVDTGNAAYGTPEGLRETIALFDVSLNALATGMPEVGVIEPPTSEISDALQAALADWAPLKAMIQEVADKAAPPQDEESELFSDVEELQEMMEETTEQYREFAALKK
ncbi:type IV pili methyl-accepting chemotaxis transducer N-terminal domain-containing protein [Tabrizicola sp.]|uniref:type IV pili methyl-accepting chemotaxis transducer N-terminal domain-containing protein n=1 Tax=Tabrizicola sp. TaxID=2005166 RepID=UPI003F36829A